MDQAARPQCQGNGCGMAPTVVVHKDDVVAEFCRVHAEYYAEHPEKGFVIVSGADTLIKRTKRSQCPKCHRDIGHDGRAAHACVRRYH